MSDAKKVGRPSKMTPQTLSKLEAAFLMGCSDVEACLYADIGHQTLYNYQKAHPEFVERKQTLKSNPVMKARGVILDALEQKDVNTAHKVIEREEGIKQRLEHSSPDRSMTPASTAEVAKAVGEAILKGDGNG